MPDSLDMFVNYIVTPVDPSCDVWQLGDEDCILPSKLQAALQQILEEREDILSHVDGDECGGLYKMLYVSQVFQWLQLLIIKLLQSLHHHQLFSSCFIVM